MSDQDSFDFIEEEEPKRPRNLNAIILNIVTVLILLSTLCVVALGAVVFFTPKVSFNPFPPPTLPALVIITSPTPEPSILLPPTWTATVTIPPTLTQTPAPTATPFPTSTSTPEDGEADVPAGGYPFVMADGSPQYLENIYHPDQGCQWLGIAGQVLDINGAPFKQQLIEVGGSLGGSNVGTPTLLLSSGMAPTYGEAGYEFVLAEEPIASNGTVWIQLVDQQLLPLSEKYYINTSDSCDQNLILINFRRVQE